MACRPKPPGYRRGSHLCALLAVVGLMLVDGCANYGNKAFLDRLNQVYRRHNEVAAAAPAGSPNTFLGLVTIGHSFGGQVLLRSVSAALEQELQSVTPTAGYLRAAVPAQPRPLNRPLHGFGDLVVLVNPAVESAAYQRLRFLSQELTYPEEQTPVMLTVSADNDVPPALAVPLGTLRTL